MAAAAGVAARWPELVGVDATTHSISMLSLSGAVRLIETRHRISTSNLIRRG